MDPVIALVGRPNVGKSTLFNRFTGSRDALVADQPGLTRDRQYGRGSIDGRTCLFIDTGGLTGDEQGIDELTAQQASAAIDESDLILFMVDARDGLCVQDELIARDLRQCSKPVLLVVNKIDGLDPLLASAEFHALGFDGMALLSASHGMGMRALDDEVRDRLPGVRTDEQDSLEQDDSRIRVAIAGRPNVGKSTLLNRMLGEDRVVVFDQPGTTRDSIFVPFDRDGRRYTLIDTAGVRRRARVSEAVEKFSVIKTLQAIECAHVVVFVIDAREGIVDQDASLLGFVLEQGRALVLAVNKWDGLEADQREYVKKELDRRLPFIDFAIPHFISALHGSGVGDLYGPIDRAYESATRRFPTPRLTEILEQAVRAHPPPARHGRRIKLRYAHQGGHNPPRIIIHGNQTSALPDSYRRYLSNTYRNQLQLEGTPVRLQFKTGENPYKGRKNKLTSRQQKQRRRLIRHVKKS